MRIERWLLPICAVFLLISSAAHGLLGWKMIRQSLVAAGIGDELLRAVAIGWYFGSVAMLVFGVLLFVCWRATAAATARRIVACIGLAYAVFGAAAFIADSFNPHFIVAFVLPGLVLGAAVIAGKWDAREGSTEE